MATRPSWKTLLEQPFVKAVRDPTLIKGIYNTCDQWCMYCPATARCLAYRCRPVGVTDGGAQNIYDNIADRMIEGMAMLRAVNAAEGRSIPELEALLANDPRRGLELARIDDPLERLGRRYAVTASRYLASHPSFPFDMTRRSGGPTPFEVFAWYHVLIPVKIYRALTSSATAAREGNDALRRDALFSAKTVLFGTERSRAALLELQKSEEDARLVDMQAQLRRLGREVDARFPEARSLTRPGLDDAGPGERSQEPA